MVGQPIWNLIGYTQAWLPMDSLSNTGISSCHISDTFLQRVLAFHCTVSNCICDIPCSCIVLYSVGICTFVHVSVQIDTFYIFVTVFYISATLHAWIWLHVYKHRQKIVDDTRYIWVNYNDLLFSLTGIMVYLGEIIPKWPNISGWWIVIIYP